MSERTVTTYIIEEKQPDFSSLLKKYLGEKAPKSFTSIGNNNILKNEKVAVFSSVKCPGSIILKTYDLMKQLRESGITVISGFHSPMEQECLNILLKGKQPVIVCPARNIEGMRIKPEYKKPLEDGRLLLLSPFTGKENRISSERAKQRNLFIAAIADKIFIPYAAPNSKTEQFCHDLIRWNKPIYTNNSEANKNLLALGIQPFNL
jgi:predicted Rossmann fold nucleotide-binding protein DprA/Smf involved in DNA uptake